MHLFQTTGFDKRMRIRSILFNILILVLLMSVSLLPLVISGLKAEARARAAQKQGEMSVAARLLETAAKRLPWRADLWQDAGQAALAAGEPEDAIRLLTRAESRGDLTLAGRIAFGQALWQTGKTDAALKTWQEGLSASNPDPELLAHLAEAYHTLGDYPAEEETLNLLVDLRPQDAQAHYRLALLLAASRPKESLHHLTLAVQLKPDLENSIRPLRRALNLALLADEPAYRLTVSGQGLAAVDEWALAQQVFAQAVRIRPDYAEGWAWLGEAEQHLGQDGSAALQRAEALNPRSALVQVFLALHYQRQGRAGLAAEHLRLAVDLEPENAAWQAALAEAYVQAGNLPPALEAYRRATQTAPKDAQYWRMLATFCAAYEYQVTEIGFPAARRALELAPEDARALDAMGQVYLALGNTSQAEIYFQRALERDPDLPEAHLHLAIVYLQTARPMLAQPALLRACNLAAGMPLGEQAQMLLDQYFP